MDSNLLECFSNNKKLNSGSNANNSAKARLFYWNTNNDPSNVNANISSRLKLFLFKCSLYPRQGPKCGLATLHITLSWSVERYDIYHKRKISKVTFCTYGDQQGNRMPLCKTVTVQFEIYMKRYGNLKEKILDDNNLELAEKRARKGKTNTYGVKRYDNRPDLSLGLIKQQLSDGIYKTSPYHVFKIYEPKEREIYQLPYYPDRIVHHILMNVLESIFVKWLVPDTYSCIKGRGIHALAKKIEGDLYNHTEETKYCLKLDIKKFYPSIDQDILIKILNKKIKDKWVMCILTGIIKSVANGVPIGNYLSQFFANIYLNQIDHWIKEVLHIKYYYRYCDDIVILDTSSKHLYKTYRQISQKLSFIKLKLKKPKLFHTNVGVDFIGYVFIPNHSKLRKDIKTRYLRSVCKYAKCDFEKRRLKLSPYYGWLAHCDGLHLLNLTIPDLYCLFKKRYVKQHGVHILKR